ncbi:MAG: hypothetical protein IPF99_33025 [Deltaproteobacteria bacterium]|nr:hypothetical protein [Deltaproteobacteria bacterium]
MAGLSSEVGASVLQSGGFWATSVCGRSYWVSWMNASKGGARRPPEGQVREPVPSSKVYAARRLAAWSGTRSKVSS